MATKPQLAIRVAFETRRRWLRIKNVYGYDASGEIRYLIEDYLRKLEKKLEKQYPEARQEMPERDQPDG